MLNALRLVAIRFVSWGEAVGRISIVGGMFLIFATAAASAGDFPARKPGLWEVTIAGPHPVKLRQCSDAASDQAMAQAGIGLSADCSKRDVQQTGAGIVIDSVCRSAGKTTTSHIVITGSLDSKYTMVMSSQAQGKPAAAPMTINGEWLGACQADQKPGEMIMPDGTKVNLLRSAGR